MKDLRNEENMNPKAWWARWSETYGINFIGAQTITLKENWFRLHFDEIGEPERQRVVEEFISIIGDTVNVGFYTWRDNVEFLNDWELAHQEQMERYYVKEMRQSEIALSQLPTKETLGDCERLVFTNPELTIIVMPYDDRGMDVIISDETIREQYREKHKDLLSTHPQGL